MNTADDLDGDVVKIMIGVVNSLSYRPFSPLDLSEANFPDDTPGARGDEPPVRRARFENVDMV